MRTCQDCGKSYYHSRRDDLGICPHCRQTVSGALSQAVANRRAAKGATSGEHLPAFYQAQQSAIADYYADKKRRGRGKKRRRRRTNP